MLTATTTLVVVELVATTIITIVRVEIPTLQATTTTTTTAIRVQAITTVTPEWETARFWKEHSVVTTPAAAATATTTMVTTVYKLFKRFLKIFNGIIKLYLFFRSTKSHCQ